jgi:hypothetical protein
VATDADWLTTIGWQGKTRLQVAAMEEISEGVYRSAEPLPVTGTWKTMIRLHRGSEMSTVPVYLPEDPAIPAEEVPAKQSFERPLTEDKQVLQREKSDDVPAWIWAASGLVVLSCWLLLIGVIGWSLVRLSRAAGETPAAPSAGSQSPGRATIAV